MSSILTLISLAHPALRWSQRLKEIFDAGMAAALPHLDKRGEDSVLSIREVTPGIVRVGFKPRRNILQLFADAGLRPLHSLVEELPPDTLRVLVMRESDGGEMGACQLPLGVR